MAHRQLRAPAEFRRAKPPYYDYDQMLAQDEESPVIEHYRLPPPEAMEEGLFNVVVTPAENVEVNTLDANRPLLRDVEAYRTQELETYAARPEVADPEIHLHPYRPPMTDIDYPMQLLMAGSPHATIPTQTIAEQPVDRDVDLQAVASPNVQVEVSDTTTRAPDISLEIPAETPHTQITGSDLDVATGIVETRGAGWDSLEVPVESPRGLFITEAAMEIPSAVPRPPAVDESVDSGTLSQEQLGVVEVDASSPDRFLDFGEEEPTPLANLLAL